MTYNLELHESAEEELWETVDYYDARKDRLGKEFARELQRVMQLIRSQPHLFPKVSGEKRKAVLKRFPYLIIFEIVENTVFVLAIFHEKRNPKVWADR